MHNIYLYNRLLDTDKPYFFKTKIERKMAPGKFSPHWGDLVHSNTRSSNICDGIVDPMIRGLTK